MLPWRERIAFLFLFNLMLTVLNNHCLTDRPSWAGDGTTASGSGEERDTHQRPVGGQASGENLELWVLVEQDGRIWLETKGLNRKGTSFVHTHQEKKKKDDFYGILRLNFLKPEPQIFPCLLLVEEFLKIHDIIRKKANYSCWVD